MTTIYTIAAILLAVAAICGFNTWRKLGEPIRPPVVLIVPEREYTSAPKPAPTIISSMNRFEPTRNQKKRSKPSRWKKQEKKRGGGRVEEYPRF